MFDLFLLLLDHPLHLDGASIGFGHKLGGIEWVGLHLHFAYVRANGDLRLDTKLGPRSRYLL